MTKIGTEIAHVTRDSDTTFKVKRSKVKVTGAEDIVTASRTAYLFIYLLLRRSSTYIYIHIHTVKISKEKELKTKI